MLVTVDKYVTVLSTECIKIVDMYRFSRKQYVLPPRIHVLLRVKDLQQKIKLSDQNICDDTDAE